jgi:hypothetical protein
MSFQSEAQAEVLKAFSEATMIGEESCRCTVNNTNDRTTIIIQGARNESDGSTTDSQVTIQESEQKFKFRISGKLEQKNRLVTFEKDIYANTPQSLASIVKQCLITSRVCRSPTLINRIGNSIGGYL